MTRSMTAYAQSSTKAIDGISWTIELHSVNRKMLDLHLHLPRLLVFLDLSFRKILSKEIHRGQVNLRIHPRKGSDHLVTLPTLKKLKSHWEKLAKELRFSKEEITLSFLLDQIDRTTPAEEISPPMQKELEGTLKATLDSFIKMREIEGKALEKDILARLKTISMTVNAISKLSEKAPMKQQQKLVGRLEGLVKEATHDERVLKEVALFAEKSDVTEEVIRLRSHIQQMKDLFQSKEKSIGRTLDFLTQEMLREINTISSKASELAMTKKAVILKSELEKIREQVQNIE